MWQLDLLKQKLPDAQSELSHTQQALVPNQLMAINFPVGGPMSSPRHAQWRQDVPEEMRDLTDVEIFEVVEQPRLRQRR